MKSARLMFMTPAIWLGWRISFAWKYLVIGVAILFAWVYLSTPLFRIHQQNIELAKGQQEGLAILVRQYALLNQVLHVKLHVGDSNESKFQGDEIAQKIDAMIGVLHTQEGTLIASRLWREWSYAIYLLALRKDPSPAICDKSIALLLELMQENARHHHRSLAQDLDIAFDFFSDNLPAVMRDLISLNVVLSGYATPDLNALGYLRTCSTANTMPV